MVGIFISYRAVDQPVGAAAIHDTLAKRFGADQVFRDCVSMKPGEHYPTVIRDRLMTASVLVAVIGPRWLTLTDEQLAIRLIDRADDWVRSEIASAFQRGIPVVPVLLKDTPENADPLAPAELPDDIKHLATLQACELSQRRFSEDMERLITRLLQLAPTLASRQLTVTATGAAIANRQTVRYRDQKRPDVIIDLVEALMTVPCVREYEGRRMLLNLIRPEIATLVPNHSRDRWHVIELVRTCLQYDGGLAELTDAVLKLENDSVPARQVASIASRLLSNLADSD